MGAFAPKGRPKIAQGGSPGSNDPHPKQPSRPEGAALEIAAPSGRGSLSLGPGGARGPRASALGYFRTPLRGEDREVQPTTSQSRLPRSPSCPPPAVRCSPPP